MSNRFQLGEWQIHASENCIARGDERVQLEPKVMDLLVFLCRHPDETLGKDEILQSVWGSLHHSDSVIARAISLLRQHLNDDARNPAYIRTIPSRGYRLIAPVQLLADGEPAPGVDDIETTGTLAGIDSVHGVADSAQAVAASPSGARRPVWAIPALLALVLLLITGFWWQQRPIGEAADARTTTSALAQLKTIAITPLADQGVPDEHRYLIHDIHEAVASALLKRGSHRVLMLPESRSHDVRSDADAYMTLAEQSGADAVLTGSAVEEASRIDVELRLVVPGSGKLLWSIRLGEDAGSEQSFRDGIVAAVTTSLGAALETPSGNVLDDSPVDPIAYRLQAQARWFVQQRSVEGVRKANELFQQAVEQDPAYADAFSGLALSFIHQIQYTGMAPDSAFAQAMAQAFIDHGYQVISGGTDNHLMLIDLRSKGVTGKDAENALVRADITVNKNMVPFDTQSPMVTSGIRVGVAAATTRGFREDDCRKTVAWIDGILQNIQDESRIEDTRREINAYMENFPLYAESPVAHARMDV